MIFFLVFAIFFTLLILSILHFKRHNEVKVVTALLIIATFASSIVMCVFFIDIPGGANVTETGIILTDRNSDSHVRFLMFISDSQGDSYWGLGSIRSVYGSRARYTPVRITYLPSTRFVLQIERYFDSSALAIPVFTQSSANTGGYRVIYSHTTFATINLFVIAVGAAIAYYNMTEKTTPHRKAKNKMRRKK